MILCTRGQTLLLLLFLFLKYNKEVKVTLLVITFH